MRSCILRLLTRYLELQIISVILEACSFKDDECGYSLKLMRKIFCNELIKKFQKEKFVFLTGDLGFNALEPLRDVMGEYFINAGIAEQNMISTAAGIAKTGIPAFVYSIAPFVYARPFEQIRNDVCLHNLPVTIIGNGGGYGYGVMGATHHGLEDYGTLLTLQNMHIFAPIFADDIGFMIDDILKLKRPSYIRLGLVEGESDVKYSPWRKILDGKNGVIIGFGTIVAKLLSDFQKEAEATRPAIWALSELPFAKEIPDDLRNLQKLCVVEEHVEQGSVAQILSLELMKKNIMPKKFVNFYAKGYVSGLYGSQAFHRTECGLTKEKILEWLNFPSHP